MTYFNDPNSRQYARITGALYLLIAVSGGFAIAYVPSELFVAGDPATTFQNISQRRGLFNLGIAGDVVMMLSEVVITAMLFFMFRAVSPALSLAAAFARLSMAIVMAGMLFFHVAALTLVDPTSGLTSFSMDQRLELAGVMLEVHNAGVWVWQLFFTLHLAVLGWLVAKSGKYPVLLGWAMTIGAFGYLLDSMSSFAFPDAGMLGYLTIALLVVVTFAEIGFALWLLIVGPRQDDRQMRANAAIA